MVIVPLDAGENRSDIVRGAPSILQDIQAELARGIYVGVEHLAEEFDLWRLVRVLLFELHDESKGSVLERCVGRSDDDCVPTGRFVSRWVRGRMLGRRTRSSRCRGREMRKHQQGHRSACAGGVNTIRVPMRSIERTLKSRIKRRLAAVDMMAVQEGDYLK